MTTRLVNMGWDAEFTKAMNDDSSYLRIICPFIRARTIKWLLSQNPDRVRVVTRFKLADFAAGVSDVDAIRQLLGANARVRGVMNLHAKVYIFGTSRTIITSANLTKSALTRNHEFGLVTDDWSTVKECRAYFDELWKRAKVDVSLEEVEDWDKTVTGHRLKVGSPNTIEELPDYGTNMGTSYSTAHGHLTVPDSLQTADLSPSGVVTDRSTGAPKTDEEGRRDRNKRALYAILDATLSGGEIARLWSCYVVDCDRALADALSADRSPNVQPWTVVRLDSEP